MSEDGDIPAVPGKPDTGRRRSEVGVPDDLDEGDILQILLDVCTIWVKALFSRRPAESYCFRPDYEDTGILIGGAYAEFPEELGRGLPRIIVMRSDVRTMGTSLTQISDYGYDIAGQDTTTFMDRLALSIIFKVVTRLDSESSKIGKYILDGLIAMRTDIQRHVRFAELITTGIRLSAPTAHGSVIPSAPSSEFKQVDVVVPVLVTNTIRNNRTGYYDLVRQTMSFTVNAVLNTVR